MEASTLRPSGRVASGMEGERILMIVTPSVSGERLVETIPPERLQGADLRLVVPAVARSALSYWLSDQRAITRAREVADEIGEAVGARARSVSSSDGDCDPALAVEDALATFDADTIIVVHGADHPGYREERLDAPALEDRLGREVEEHLVG